MRLWRRKRLHAIGDEALEEALAGLDLLDSLRGGSLQCTYCGRIVEIDSIGGLLSENGVPKVFCDLPDCAMQARESSTRLPPTSEAGQ